MKRTNVAVGLCAVLAVFFMSQPILAQKAFLKKLKEAYPQMDPKFANCVVCHAVNMAKREKPGKKNLNAYGKDLQAAPEAKDAMGKEGKHEYTDSELQAVAAGIKAIGSKDSNGNGKSNDDDLKANVNPGVK